MSLLPYLHRLMNKESLPASEAHEAMLVILHGGATAAQIAAFAVALRMKGETVEELCGLATAMRDNMIRVDPGPLDEPLLDTCGTGGDGQSTLNVSTIAAFVIAGAGVRVAKHGNRSHTSRCGSADVLEALGARIDLRPDQMGRCIRETGIGFLYAPILHPAMRHAAVVRSELRTRTAFNLLGPLVNPAGANVQLTGAPSLQTAALLAAALAELGLRRGFVVHGDSGLDEVSTTGPSVLLSITPGATDSWTVTPEDFGLRRATLDELRGEGPESNRDIARGVLSGRPGAYRDIVVANSAVALLAAGKASNLKDAAAIACESIDSGAARRKLESLVALTTSWNAA
ncbi:MAG: anthranilate phosphoribosyltransferase [Bryobacterales bacterium]|nr:anthranilate phosphoribosyltransferase [Bryobacterales bacterium]